MSNKYGATRLGDDVSHAHDTLSDPAKLWLSNQGYIGCAVQFEGGNTDYYYFYSPKKFELQVGDTALVPARGEYKLVTVSKINLPFGQVYSKATKLVAAHVSTKWHEKAMNAIALQEYQHAAMQFAKQHAEAAQVFSGLVGQADSPFALTTEE